MRNESPKESAYSGYVCDFSHVHPLTEACRCSRKYKVLPFEFRRALLSKVGIWKEETVNGKTRTVLARPVYPSEVSPNVRDEVLRELTSHSPSAVYEILEKRNLA